MPRRLVLALLLVLSAALGLLAEVAFSARHVRSDPPAKVQTFAEPQGDNPAGAPDILSVVAENWADGTIGFHILLPRETVLDASRGVGIYLDTDLNRSTGQFGDDYLLAIAGRSGSPPLIELHKWNRTWGRIDSKSLQGETEFPSGKGIIVTIDKEELAIATRFNFDVWSTVVGGGGVQFSDQAPTAPEFFTYTLGTAEPGTTTTVKTCVVPKVVGKPLARAETLVVNAGCKIGAVSHVHSTKVKKGRVVSTMPAAGRSVAVGTRVKFAVSDG